jgi:hypothetical protein
MSRPRWSRVLALATVAAVAGLGLLACSSDDDRPAKITRTGEIRPPEGPERKLRRTPSPLTARDISKQPRGSAPQALMLLWFYGQWGSTPSIYWMYSAKVRRAFGPDVISGAYTESRADMLHVQPRIVGTRRSAEGTLVTMELLSATDPPRVESFLFAREDRRWRVRYDTYFAAILQGYVQSRTQERINAAAERPSPLAVAAGLRASRRYRALFLPR